MKINETSELDKHIHAFNLISSVVDVILLSLLLYKKLRNLKESAYEKED